LTSPTSDAPHPPGRPRNRPPWWPDDEPWPPRRRWRHGPFYRGFGCVFGFAFLLVFVSVLTNVVIATANASGITPFVPGVLILLLVVGIGASFRRTGGTLD
jgi:hypothetical protein